MQIKEKHTVFVQQSLMAKTSRWLDYLRLHSESAQSFLADSLGICLPASEVGNKRHTDRASQSLQCISGLYVKKHLMIRWWTSCGLFEPLLHVSCPRERRRSNGSLLFLLSLPPLCLILECTQSSFQIVQAGKQDGGRGGGGPD